MMARAKKPKTLEAWTEQILNNSDGFVSLEDLYQQASEALAVNGIHKLNNQKQAVQDELIAALTERETNPSQENSDLIYRCNVKMQIVDKAIERRRSLHREKSYFLEKTLAGTPMFSVTKPNKKASKTSGQIVRQGAKASIRHAANEELTPFDARILMAIHKLWEQKGKNKEIEINMYEILSTSHLETTGRTYDYLEESLLRLFRVEIRFEEITEERESKQFVHMLQEVGFERGKAEAGKDAKFRIIFADRIFNSLQKGYLEYLSMALWEDLSSGAAQLLYTRLPSEFRSGRTQWELEELCEMVNINPDRPAKRKAIIDKALSELELFGAIRRFKIWEDYGGITRVSMIPTEMMIGHSDGLSVLASGEPLFKLVDGKADEQLELFDTSKLVAATQENNE